MTISEHYLYQYRTTKQYIPFVNQPLALWHFIWKALLVICNQSFKRTLNVQK